MKVELVRITQDPIMAIASAGANCYDSLPSERIVDHCYDSGHHSIFEFSVFHFHISGVSRALTHQLVRHRVASFAQRSQRYVNEDGFKYVTPPTIGIEKSHTLDVSDMSYCFNDNNVQLSYPDFMKLSRKFYNALQDYDVPNEDARYVLPNACASVIDMQMNFRELMHFCNVRLCTRAQWEIRELAQKMVKLITAQHPRLERFLVPKCEANKPHCFCTEKKSCGKWPTLATIFKNNDTKQAGI